MLLCGDDTAAGLPKEAIRRNESRSACGNLLELREMRVGIKKEPAILQPGRVVLPAGLTPAMLVDERSSVPVCGPTEQTS